MKNFFILLILFSILTSCKVDTQEIAVIAASSSNSLVLQKAFNDIPSERHDIKRRLYEIFIENKSCPNSILEDIYNDNDKEEGSYYYYADDIITHPNADLKFCEKLYMDDNDLASLLLKRKDVSKSTLLKLATNNNFFDETIIEQKNYDGEVLTQLLKSHRAEGVAYTFLLSTDHVENHHIKYVLGKITNSVKNNSMFKADIDPKTSMNYASGETEIGLLTFLSKHSSCDSVDLSKIFTRTIQNYDQTVKEDKVDARAIAINNLLNHKNFNSENLQEIINHLPVAELAYTKDTTLGVASDYTKVAEYDNDFKTKYKNITYYNTLTIEILKHKLMTKSLLDILAKKKHRFSCTS